MPLMKIKDVVAVSRQLLNTQADHLKHTEKLKLKEYLGYESWTNQDLPVGARTAKYIKSILFRLETESEGEHVS